MCECLIAISACRHTSARAVAPSTRRRTIRPPAAATAAVDAVLAAVVGPITALVASAAGAAGTARRIIVVTVVVGGGVDLLPNNAPRRKRLLNDHSLVAAPIGFLVLAVDNTSKDCGDEEHDDIRNRESPGRLEEVAVVGVSPGGVLIIDVDIIGGDTTAVVSDVNDLPVVIISAFGVCHPRCRRNTGDQAGKGNDIPEDDPKGGVIGAVGEDEDAEGPDGTEDTEDEKGDDASGGFLVGSVVPVDDCCQEGPCGDEREHLEHSEDGVRR